MTAREYLGQVYRIDQKINSSITEIKRLRALADSIRSPSLTEHTSPNRQTDAPFVRALERIWQAEERLDTEIARMIELKEQVRAAIERVQNPNEQIVLRYRYINEWTWERICDSLRANRATVYRWHNAALKHVILPENAIQIATK